MLPQRSIRGIVFDLDGVLTHSTGCHRAAFEEVLKPLGITDFDYSKYAGWRTPEVIAAEFQRAGLPMDDEAIRAAATHKTLLARQKMTEMNPVAEHSREVLEKLSGNYQLALASSGSHGSVYNFLNANRFERFFQSILSGEDVTNAKPDPEIYRKTFAALGLKPDSCMVVEDAVSGIESARRAGAAAVGIKGTCSAELLLRAGALCVLNDLRQLAPLVDSL